MDIPTVRKPHPPTSWCRGLKKIWKVNNIFTVYELILCGNRCCLLLSFFELPSDFSWWIHCFLGWTEIANGLCWDYKKDELGQAVIFFFTVFIREGLSLASKNERLEAKLGWFVPIFNIWNAFDRDALIFLFTWRALGRGQSINKMELY